VLLPGHLEPEHYKLQLIPFLAPGNFSIAGSVTITVSCVASGSTNVTLHARGIAVKTISLTCQETGQPINVNGFYFDEEREFLVGDLEEEIKEGHKYEIHIDFEGHLNEQLFGFYRNSYYDESGRQRWALK
jgi:aminopeptidase N